MTKHKKNTVSLDSWLTVLHYLVLIAMALISRVELTIRTKTRGTFGDTSPVPKKRWIRLEDIRLPIGRGSASIVV